MQLERQKLLNEVIDYCGEYLIEAGDNADLFLIDVLCGMILKERQEKEFYKKMAGEIMATFDPNNEMVLKPDESNIYNKRQFTFLIEAFLRSAVKECNGFDDKIYDELMEFWEKW